MSRFLVTLVLACTAILAGALPALAEGTYPPDDKGATVAGGGGAAETAFTGGEISSALLATAALLAIGLGALLVARRRAARLSG